MRFTKDGVREVSRRILDTLKNLYLFFSQYANLDGYRPQEGGAPPGSRALLDRWILSRLDSLVERCHSEMDRLEISRCGRAVEQFVIEDLSNWYVRRSRERFWAPGFEADKRAAFDTLFESLSTVARLLAPFTPFLAERVYLALTEGSGARERSVHLESYPEPRGELRDEDLERRMEDVRRIVRLGRAARNRANVKVRQPLSRVRIVPPAGEAGLGDLTQIVLDELNVKRAEHGAPGEAPAELAAKARFDVLGPRFGKNVQEAARAIAALSRPAILELERSGATTVNVAGSAEEIRREEVQVTHTDPEGWVLERERGWWAALDLAIDEELRREGFAREIVNKIQFMRRKAGFGITDRIEVSLEGTETLRAALARHGELIRAETQADRIGTGAIEAEAREEWKINGEPAVISLKRI
jgi:isoleucyl-tRNA synthetase